MLNIAALTGIKDMHTHLLKTLLEKNLIQEPEANGVHQFEENKPFSLHWELKTLLYLGVLLLNGGLGFLIYENIDSIGHIAIIAAIGAVSLGCFWYSYRHRMPFTRGQLPSPTPYFDYVLLLGCLTFLIMEGYLQYQYTVFGTRYGLATFIPMVLFFALAYYFDHRGVLALAITALATWLGITVTPHELLRNNDFNSETIIITGVGLGVLLSLIPFLKAPFQLKPHFFFTYLNFGIHLLMIACLNGMWGLDKEIIYFPILLAGAIYYLWYARENKSFYFLIVPVIYTYIAFTSLLLRHFRGISGEGYMLYFIFSCGAIIALLVQYKKFFRS